MTTTEFEGTIPTRPTTTRTDWLSVPRVSWAAVFAGVVMMLVVQLMLSVLGVGVGGSAVDVLHSRHPMAGLSIAAGIWLVVSMFIAHFSGGFVAGRLAGVVRHMDGALHGAVAWGLSTLLAFYLVTSAVGEVAGTVAKGAGEVGNAVGQATSGQDVGGAAKGMVDLGGRISRDNGRLTAQDREAAINDVMRSTGESRADAERTVSDSENMYQQAQQKFQQAGPKAREIGDQAAKDVGRGSLLLFVGMLVSGILASLGGRVGAHRAQLLVRRTVEY
jgi:hypothetical protein